MRNLCLFFLLFIICLHTNGQSSGGSFFDKLYLPFGVGYTLSPGGGIQSGFILKTGAEVRLKNRQGLFLRFDYDNRSNSYQDAAIDNTNAVKGKIDVDDFLFGMGYRSKVYKGISAYILVQGGMSNYSYPSIEAVANGFDVSQKSKMVPVVAGIGGIECYFVKSAAIFIEGGFIYHAEQPFMKISAYDMIGITIGITTKLF